MRHRRRGRILGRSPSHRRAMLRNLAAAIFLTERDAEFDDNKPKVKGRIITTREKAKEVRPIVEKCITLAVRAHKKAEAAAPFATNANRGEAAWKTWRKSENWRKWAQAMAPVVAARRHIRLLLGDKQATKLCYDVVAPRFMERPGGYTRILKLAKPRLGDAGARAILEFVGVRDRVIQRAEKPAFGSDTPEASESNEN